MTNLMTKKDLSNLLTKHKYQTFKIAVELCDDEDIITVNINLYDEDQNIFESLAVVDYIKDYTTGVKQVSRVNKLVSGLTNVKIINIDNM